MNTTIIIMSDLHLASDVCRSKKILDFLHSIDDTTKLLILNGDVMDNLNFKRLSKDHWKILKKLRSIAKWCNVVWIKGNHDTEQAEVIANLIGVQFVEQIETKIGNKNLLIIHGDKFDVFMKKRPITSKIADYCYKCIQSYDKWRKNDWESTN